MRVPPPPGMTQEMWDKLKSTYDWSQFPDTRRGKRKRHRALLDLRLQAEKVFGAMKRNKTFSKKPLGVSIHQLLEKV